jgi:uncharacterized protein YjbI with pentapeptide repeats/DNA-directed RNA polymerase specialized sigma24 family protein
MDYKNDILNESVPLSRQELGRLNEQKGRSFEERVVEAYRLLHYQVEHGRLFSGRQVDLFLTGHFGDLVVHRAIECKAGPVSADDLDAFLSKLVLVRREHPSAQGTIISGVSFTDAVSSHAAAIGVQLTLFRDLSAQLLDGHGYAQSLLREIESNQRYPLSLYVEPNIGFDTLGDSLLGSEVIADWLEDGSWNQLTLLGDVGAGKTFLSRIVTHRLLLDFLKSPLDKPLPIRVDLRNADREFSLEGLILTHLSRVGLGRTTFDVFQYLLAQGRLVLILDGFDEMAARVTPVVTRRNFFELNRCVQGRAKIMLTCRTHYFRSQKEEGEIVFGESSTYRSEGARDLYWELIARHGFRIAYLRPFQLRQIEQYVAIARKHDSQAAFKKIKDIYNLLELSQRPLLLEMIVKSLDKLGDKDINASTLYEVFTDAWIHRDRWRDVLSPESKLQFLMSLARSLWKEDLTVIHYNKLREHLQAELAAEVDEPQKLLEIDNEVRTASFLTRDNMGNYGFAHKSYMEFFLARHLASRLALREGEEESLSLSRLSPEVLGFLRDMIDLVSTADLCQKILQSEYKPRISENALLLLYSIKSAALESSPASSAGVQLLEGARLNGAQLDYAVLEGAILMGSDLCDASLKEAALAGIKLSGSKMNRVSLDKANLSEADLRNCSLEGASLISTNFFGANLTNSILTGANIKDALFLDSSHAEDPKSNRESRDHRGITGVWDFIEKIYPQLQRIALSEGYRSGVDREELLSSVVADLMRPEILKRLEGLTLRQRNNYLYQICHRTEMDLSRQAHRRNYFNIISLDSGEGQLYTYTLVEEDNSPESRAINKDLVAKIASMVQPKIFRVAYALLVEGKSRTEIADEENVSLGTIGRRFAKWREAANYFAALWQ